MLFIFTMYSLLLTIFFFLFICVFVVAPLYSLFEAPCCIFLCCNERFWQSSTLSSDNMHLNLEINASTWDHKNWVNHWFYALVGWCFYNLSIEYYKHRIKTTFCLSCSHMKNSCNYPVLQNSCPRNIFSTSQSNHHCRFTWYC